MPYDPSQDPYQSLASSLATPASDCVAVTPSDSDDIAPYPKALRVYVPASVAGGVGSVKLTPKHADDAAPVTLKFLPGVYQLPLGVRRVWATGTSSGIEIHGYWG